MGHALTSAQEEELEYLLQKMVSAKDELSTELNEYNRLVDLLPDLDTEITALNRTIKNLNDFRDTVWAGLQRDGAAQEFVDEWAYDVDDFYADDMLDDKARPLSFDDLDDVSYDNYKKLCPTQGE